MDVNKTRFIDSVLNAEDWARIGGDLISAASNLEESVRKFWDAAHDSMESAKQGEQKSIPSYGVLGIYFMLISYGIENLLKSIIVRQESAVIKECLEHGGGLFDTSLHGHKLRELARRAGLESYN
jgi:hypothetical protein